jgi:hypothetical protein
MFRARKIAIATILFLALCSILSITPAHGEFTTILNIPPDPNIRNDGVIGSDSQLNLFDGGLIGVRFNAGHQNGTSSNVEVNVFGGFVGDYFSANSGSTVNIYGGSGLQSLRAKNGSTVNIISGSVEGLLDALDGSVVNVSGGSVGISSRAFDGSTVNISGGFVDSNFKALDGSTVNISGGTGLHSFSARAGSAVNVAGGEFRLDGLLIGGLETVGNTLATDLPEGSVLSGTMADGTPYTLTSLDADGFADGTLTLEAAVLPDIGPAVITLPADPLPPGLRSGQTLIVEEGGTVGDHFNAGWGSRVVIDGGNVGGRFEVVGTDVTISGGSVGYEFRAYVGSTVNVTGGVVMDGFSAYGSVLNISGGSIGSMGITDGTAIISGGSVRHLGLLGATAEISGGSFCSVNVGGGGLAPSVPGATLNISGGSFDEDCSFQAFEGNTVNLFGTGFALDDVDITASLSRNEPFTISARDVPFSGLLADGSPFHFELGTNFDFGVNFFAPDATLTVTLVQPGDTNGDGLVDIDDLNAVRNNFGAGDGSDLSGIPGDASPFDGLVNIDDLNAVRNHFGAGTAAAAVPEPASWLLLVFVLTFVALARLSHRTGTE